MRFKTIFLFAIVGFVGPLIAVTTNETYGSDSIAGWLASVLTPAWILGMAGANWIVISIANVTTWLMPGVVLEFLSGSARYGVYSTVTMLGAAYTSWALGSGASVVLLVGVLLFLLISVSWIASDGTADSGS